MEIRVLKYFLAVAREENISRAAEILHITQPTLSRQISQLEKELGTRLLERGRRLRLTDAGVMLKRRAEEVTELVDKIEVEFAGAEEMAGKISIGEGALKSSAILMDAMIKFRESYPQVQYEIYSNTSDYIKERLDKGLCDFGLLLEPVDIEKYDFIRLPEKERWGLFMRKDHPLSEKEVIRRKDLEHIPLITPSRLSVQREIANWLGKDQDLNIFSTCNIITNAQITVDPGQICFLTIEGAMDRFQREELVFRPLCPALELTSVLVWKKYQPLSRTAERFVRVVKDLLEKQEIKS